MLRGIKAIRVQLKLEKVEELKSHRSKSCVSLEHCKQFSLMLPPLLATCMDVYCNVLCEWLLENEAYLRVNGEN